MHLRWILGVSICWISLSLQFAAGQSADYATITGTVVNDSTSFPLHNVNVFLSNTTLGSATDENGRFRITYVPPGKYRLAASMIGYELQVYDIEIASGDHLTYTFRLEPSPIQGEEIEVVAEYPAERKANLRRFRTIFLGTGPNARQCQLVNPEVLRFEVDKERGSFEVSSVRPLIVENRALGYRLTLYIERFEWRDDETGGYYATVRYEELTPENQAQMDRWEKRRRRAYEGSRRHFLRALTSGNYWKEGFDLFHVRSPRIQSRATRAQRVVRANQTLLSETDISYIKELSFSGHLQVVYRPFNQISWMDLTLPSVMIDTLGNIYQPRNLIVSGYWKKHRVADELPANYTPGD